MFRLGFVKIRIQGRVIVHLKLTIRSDDAFVRKNIIQQLLKRRLQIFLLQQTDRNLPTNRIQVLIGDIIPFQLFL